MTTLRAANRATTLVLCLAVACSKQSTNKDTTISAGTVAPPPVAVTTEIAPGVLMTVEAGPGTGLVLVDDAGRAMYILDAVPTDTNTWKPVSGNLSKVSSDPNVKSSLIGTTATAGGGTQATYNGKPLYYYSGDAKAGDRTGQGKTASGATGHLVGPQGNAAGSGGAR